MLELIRQGHSLRSACQEIGMAYSKGWRLLKLAEEDLGFPLIEARKGGAHREGSTLTPQGEELLNRYLAFQKEANQLLDQLFQKYFSSSNSI